MDRGKILTILEKWFKDPVDVPCCYCEAAKEICQLFEPDEETPLQHLNDEMRLGMYHGEPKPDESRLLTEDEETKAWREGWHYGGGQVGAIKSIAKAQLAKDQAHEDKVIAKLNIQFNESCFALAENCKVHEQATVERIFNDIGEKLEAAGLSLRYLRILRSEWQALKKQEGIAERVKQ